MLVAIKLRISYYLSSFWPLSKIHYYSSGNRDVKADPNSNSEMIQFSSPFLKCIIHSRLHWECIMGPIFFRKKFKKIREHQHDLERCFSPEKLAITLPATYLKEMTLKLIKEFDIIHIFATSFGITQPNYIN